MVNPAACEWRSIRVTSNRRAFFGLDSVGGGLAIGFAVPTAAYTLIVGLRLRTLSACWAAARHALTRSIQPRVTEDTGPSLEGFGTVALVTAELAERWGHSRVGGRPFVALRDDSDLEVGGLPRSGELADGERGNHGNSDGLGGEYC
jgi:hypothetical protein